MKGTSFTYFTTDNAKSARELLSILKEAKADIPPQLEEMSMFGGGGGGRSKLRLHIYEKHQCSCTIQVALAVDVDVAMAAAEEEEEEAGMVVGATTAMTTVMLAEMTAGELCL